ncbi:hypothetical protein GCM10010211_12060 [Streptomyces albospinus]|uniref:Uncharacterized protein n=1 Tax=Streptomyces albospinus TaxID=285515 RepID=A0ABQ2URF3_9ACTN|nr:hypothetical protein GCM10010211_12060 [Streptomyces albospinus]
MRFIENGGGALVRDRGADGRVGHEVPPKSPPEGEVLEARGSHLPCAGAQHGDPSRLGAVRAHDAAGRPRRGDGYRVPEECEDKRMAGR